MLKNYKPIYNFVMVDFFQGNLFDDKADYLINTVNCVGVMGKGIALEFKKKYPEMFEEYKKECASGNIKIGKPFLWVYKDFFDEKTIINLPTKIHWKDPSEYAYIIAGIDWLKSYFEEHKNATVALPPLGCGCGGLAWHKVKRSLVEALSPLSAQFNIYEPLVDNKKYWSL